MATKKKEETLQGGLAALLNINKEKEREAEEEQRQALEAVESTIQDDKLREALRQRRFKQRRGRPKKGALQRQREEELCIRSTIVLPRVEWAKFREICLKEGITLRELTAMTLARVVQEYEEAHGEIRITPQSLADARTLQEILRGENK